MIFINAFRIAFLNKNCNTFFQGVFFVQLPTGFFNTTYAFSTE